MEKKMVEKVIFTLTKRDHNYNFRISDLPETALPTDFINIMRDDPHECEEWETACSELEVSRERPETDEEFEERLNETKAELKRIEERQYAQYLRLKQKYESETSID